MSDLRFLVTVLDDDPSHELTEAEERADIQAALEQYEPGTHFRVEPVTAPEAARRLSVVLEGSRHG